jgi:mono/diheme cytochrome c family protein
MQLRLRSRTPRRWMLVAACAMFVARAGAGVAGERPSLPAGEVAPDGAQVFRTYCASCHGVRGTGDGPVAIAMKKPPPDLTRIAVRNRGVFPDERVRQIIQGRGPAAHGERTMPVWGDVFARKVAGPTPEALVEALVRHLDGLQERTGE